MKTVTRLFALAVVSCALAAAMPAGSAPASLPGAAAVLVQDAHAKGSSSSRPSSSGSRSGYRSRSSYDDDYDDSGTGWTAICVLIVVGWLGLILVRRLRRASAAA